MNLKEKVILITGAGSGVGQNLAVELEKLGASLVLLDISEKGLKQTLNSLSNQNTEFFILDVRSSERWVQVIDKVLEKYKKIDILFNVAGYLFPGYVHEFPLEEIDKHVDINVKGVILGTKLCSKIMIKQGFGHIINIASLAGISPVPGLSLYSASKFAVRGFSLSVAQELKEKGIFVTVVCPDAIQTPMLDVQKNREEARLTFSGGKILSVNEISKLILGVVLKKKPREITIPKTRGFLAKLANLLPNQIAFLYPLFLKLGRKTQKKLQEKS